jgi:hypothetical protein
VINTRQCASDQLDIDFTQRSLFPKDDNFRSIIQLFDRCFNHDHRVLLVVAEGKTLPEAVLRHIHSRNSSYPVIFMRADEMRGAEGILSKSMHQSSDSFLLFLDRFDQIETVLYKMKSLSLWNPRGTFMLVVSQPLISNKKIVLENAFKRLWTEKILRVILIFRFYGCDQCNEDTEDCRLLTPNLQVLTYNPFKHFRGINYITDISNVWPKINNVGNFFPSLSDLHGYPLRVAMFPMFLSVIPILGPDGQVKNFDGYDAHTVESLAWYMNAKMILVPPSDNTLYGYKVTNGTITGTSGDVAYNRADIAANSRYMVVDWVEVEYTYPHGTDNLCFVVPKSKRAPQYKNLFRPFSCFVWIVLLFTISSTSIFWYCVQNYEQFSVKEKTNKATISEAFFDIFRSFISGTLSTIPTSFLGRVYIATWLFMAVIITNTYQGCLTSYLAVPKHLKEINTLKQLDKSGLGIFVVPGVQSYLAVNGDDKTMRNLWRKFKYETNYSLIYNSLVQKTDMGILSSDNFAQYFLINGPFIKDGEPLLHKVKENIMFLFTVYNVPRHSPFLPRFNVIITRLLEAGLLMKWNRDSVRQAALNGYIKTASDVLAADPTPLSLTHLQTAFYMLIFGLFCSTLIFVSQLRKVTHHEDKMWE